MARARGRRLQQFFIDNGLSICMFGLFLVFLAGLAITGHQHNNEELLAHHQPAEGFGQYIISGDFMEAVSENWESEFLQMAALVIATIFLYQKGAADSHRPPPRRRLNTSSRYSIIQAHTWSQGRRSLRRAIYANSLSLALVSLFIVSLILHALGGARAYNEEAAYHGETPLSTAEYIQTSQFWYESFQNWQSEFLAVGALLVLSIYLRQRHSPESKPVDKSDQATGG